MFNENPWHEHPTTIPYLIDRQYEVMLKGGEIEEDTFTGFNWYNYDWTDIIAWRYLTNS